MHSLLWGTLIALGMILVLLQILSSGPVLRRLLTWAFGQYATVSFRGPGFILPLLYFHARDLKIHAPGHASRDRIYFQADSIRFRLEPIFLLIGRIRLMNMIMEKPLLDYINRQHSHLKNRFLPPRHRVELKNAVIRDGWVRVHDETMTPHYTIAIHDINLENADMDVATSIDVFFRAGRGTAGLGSGKIEIGGSDGKGFIRVWGVTWGELTALGDSLLGPFMGGKLALEAFHFGGSEGRAVHGTVANIPRYDKSHDDYLRIDDLSIRIPFEFNIDWENYRLTFDLGLLRIIDKLLRGARSDGISVTSGLLPGIRGIFDMVKKQER